MGQEYGEEFRWLAQVIPTISLLINLPQRFRTCGQALSDFSVCLDFRRYPCHHQYWFTHVWPYFCPSKGRKASRDKSTIHYHSFTQPKTVSLGCKIGKTNQHCTQLGSTSIMVDQVGVNIKNLCIFQGACYWQHPLFVSVTCCSSREPPSFRWDAAPTIMDGHFAIARTVPSDHRGMNLTAGGDKP